MNSWDQYNFASRLKVRVKETGQVGFLTATDVIDLLHSPLVPGTPAALWCDWQLQLIKPSTFHDDFRAAVLTAMKSGRHSAAELIDFFERFTKMSKTLKTPRAGDLHGLEGQPIILFRFYTGDPHGLLPKLLSKTYGPLHPLEPESLLNEKPPVVKEKSKNPLHRVGRSVFQQDMLPTGLPPSMVPRKSVGLNINNNNAIASTTGTAINNNNAIINTATFGSSMHGQGYTQDSPYVSTGPSLPNLIASTSKKLMIIMRGKDFLAREQKEQDKDIIMKGQVRDELEQALFLGCFFVPGAKWKPELTGYESQQEREIVYDGFDSASGYIGLWEYELFTLPNPFRLYGGYGATIDNDLAGAFLQK